ncbi:MAG: hypothetical protein ACRDRT_00025 [Pseudonocardiaceae bacterium]
MVGLLGGWDDRWVDLGGEGLGSWVPLCRRTGGSGTGGDHQSLRLVVPRFPLSFREVEEMMMARGVLVTYETIRQWCRKFG